MRFLAAATLAVVPVVALAIASQTLRADRAAAYGQTAETTPTGGSPSDDASAVDPHWSREHCFSCHPADDGPPALIARETVDALCLRCHDGEKASMEPHPVGRVARTALVTVPPGWPTPNDRIGCVTCHDMMRAGEHSFQPRGENHAFLRGEVHTRSVAFCANCHTASGYEPFNPHRMPDGGDRSAARDDQCRFCHATAMPRDAQRRTGSPGLVSEEITLCASCHDGHGDFFDPGHIGAVMPAEMIRRLSEKPGWHARSGKDGDGPAATVLEQMPLAADDRVVCSTCHNPHPTGVFPDESILALGASTFDGSDADRAAGVASLRVPTSAFCSACHFP